MSKMLTILSTSAAIKPHSTENIDVLHPVLHPAVFHEWETNSNCLQNELNESQQHGNEQNLGNYTTAISK